MPENGLAFIISVLALKKNITDKLREVEVNEYDTTDISY